MSRSATRQRLRTQRQKQARSLLTDDQVRAHPKAAEQFIIFSKRWFRPITRTFESFVEEHG